MGSFSVKHKNLKTGSMKKRVSKKEVPRESGNSSKISKREVTELSRKKRCVTRLNIFFNKSNNDPIVFAQYVIKACIKAVSDYLSMEKIVHSLQTCIIQ